MSLTKTLRCNRELWLALSELLTAEGHGQGVTALVQAIVRRAAEGVAHAAPTQAPSREDFRRGADTAILTIGWSRDLEATLKKLALSETEKPRDSADMLRRLIFRAAGLPGPSQGTRPRVSKPRKVTWRRGPLPKPKPEKPEIAKVGLSTWVSNILINACILTLEDLKRAHRLSHMGVGSQVEIEMFLKLGIEAGKVTQCSQAGD